MSFLAGRLAAMEGAFFLQESKSAAGRLARRLPSAAGDSSSQPLSAEDAADVLPEILRHSVPIRGGDGIAAGDPSLSTSKWLLKPSANSFVSSPDVLNPLRAYVKLPPATFGPKRWQVPHEQPTVAASTANDMRRDRYSTTNSKQLEAVASGLSMIAKAFVVATTIVFGGAAATVYQLQMNTVDDLKSKVKDLIQPGANVVREHIGPLRAWAENMSRKWHIEGDGAVKEKPIVKELSKVFGARPSS